MVTGTWSVAWLRVERRGFWARWWGGIILSSRGHPANFWTPHPHACMLCTSVHAHVSEKEGALAPESALWGDHSCTLPAANWSLSSCPIHLHFLPITEHYLCSQLGMGLNPFWLSWCYSLQISNGDGEGNARGKRKGGKVQGKGSGGKSHSENKLWNFPSSLTSRKQSMNNDITRRREEKWKRSIIGIIIQVLVCKRCSLID